MRLQLLGDGPDAFKWDFVHWLCTRSIPPYSHLVFVPMLRPDEAGSTEGQTPHERFNCRPEIRRFVSLLRSRKSLDDMRDLGSLDPERRFEVVIWPPADRYIGAGVRAEYWTASTLDGFSNVLTFIDPDTGFETKTQDGEKWVRHYEVKRLLDGGECDGIIVYQHRPQRQRWDHVFAKLYPRLGYATYIAAVFDSNVAFVLLARTEKAAARLGAAARAYCERHGSIRYRVLNASNGDGVIAPSILAPHREPRVCECGCGGSTKNRFMPGHDSKLGAWVLRVERGVMRLDEIPHDGIKAAVARVLERRTAGV